MAMQLGMFDTCEQRRLKQIPYSSRLIFCDQFKNVALIYIYLICPFDVL